VPHPVTPEAAAPAPQLGLAFGGPPAGSAPVPAARPRDQAAGAEAEVIEALRAVDADDLSPRAALDLVARLTKKLAPPS
jgi:hypothetical protein